MGGIRVDPAVLGDVDAALAASAAHTHAQLAALRAAALELLGGWHGAGGAAFANAWHDWHAGVLGLLAALDHMARTLGACGFDYARTEDAVRTSMVAS